MLRGSKQKGSATCFLAVVKYVSLVGVALLFLHTGIQTARAAVAPTVTSPNMTNLTPTSVDVTYSVTNDGGAPLTARGFCWSDVDYVPASNPTCTNDGTSLGSLTKILTGYPPNKIIYVTTYATNNAGLTGYGGEQFTSLPGIPTNLIFSNVGSTLLRVSWTAPSGGATSYKVERCQEGSGCPSYSQIASGITNAYYDDSGLSAGTTYRYQVRARNAAGDGAYSSPAEVTTNSAPVISIGSGYTSLGVNAPHDHTGVTVTDVDNNLSTYVWSLTACPAACPSITANVSGALTGGSSAVTVPAPQFTPNATGNYTLQLIVADTSGASDTKTVIDTAINTQLIVEARNAANNALIPNIIFDVTGQPGFLDNQSTGGTGSVALVRNVSSAEIQTVTPDPSVQGSWNYNAGASTVSSVLNPGSTLTLTLKFDANPSVSSVSPNNGLTSGGQSVTISGSNFSNGTVGFWHLDEAGGPNAADSSGKNNAGTVVGATVATGQYGSNARSFNGTSDYISTPLPTTATSDVSISAWFKTNNYTNDRQVIVYNGNGANSGYGVTINSEGQTTGELKVLYGGVVWFGTGVTITDSNWHHVVLNIMSDKHPELYLDGTKIFTGAVFTPNVPTASLGIGTDYSGAGTPFFNGVIDEVRVYSRTLSATEISDLMLNTDTVMNVQFDSVNATNISFVSSTSLTATTPAHASGGVDVTVVNFDGQAGSCGFNCFTYQAVNQAPISDAGSDQNVNEGNLVTLNGTGSSDPDGNLPLTYAWSQTAGPAITLSSTTAASPTFTAPSVSSDTTFIFSLTVTDSLSLADPTPDTVNIVVLNIANNPPTAVITPPGLLSAIIIGRTYVLSGAGSTDPEWQVLTYHWDITLGGAGAVLSAPDSSITNFTANQVGSYQVKLTVTDPGGLSGSALTPVSPARTLPKWKEVKP